MIWSIRLYQWLAHAKHQLIMSVFGYSSTCHHQPSCSEYTIQQIKESGTIVGLWRGLRRLLTCY